MRLNGGCIASLSACQWSATDYDDDDDGCVRMAPCIASNRRIAVVTVAAHSGLGRGSQVPLASNRIHHVVSPTHAFTGQGGRIRRGGRDWERCWVVVWIPLPPWILLLALALFNPSNPRMEEDAAARQALLATIQAFVGRHQTATDGEEDRLCTLFVGQGPQRSARTV